MYKNRTLFFVGGFLLLVALLSYILWQKHDVQPTQKISCDPHCNVILIVEDALAAGHLKTYGYSRDTLPQTTAFFEKNGVIFDQATAVSPWTLPSFSAMYFSDLASDITYKDIEPGNRANMISLLRDTKAVTIRAVTPPPGLFIYDVIEKPYAASELIHPATYNDTFTTSAQVLPKLATQDNPFLLVIHSLKVHDPYQPTDEYKEIFGTSPEFDTVTMKDLLTENAKPTHATSTTDVFELRYDQGIREEDARISGFLKTIPPDVLANTVIIFTADHGEAFNEHGTFWHAGSLYQEQLHIPLMVYAPGVSPKRVSEPVSLLDMAPTILTIMHGEILPSLLGDNFTPLLFGHSLGDRIIRFVNGFPSYLDAPAPGKKTFFSLAQTGKEGSDESLILPSQKGMREGNLKIITQGTGGPVDIFDLASDPHELHPLVQTDTRVSVAFLAKFLHTLYPSCGLAKNKYISCTKDNTDR